MGHQQATKTRVAETSRQRSTATSAKPSLPTRASIHPILHLQQTIGNQAVQRLLRSGVLQAKLRIGQSGDKYEQEADRLAEQVMRMPEPRLQRQVEPEQEEEMLQAKALAAQITPLVQRQVEPEEEEEEEELIQAKQAGGQTPYVGPGPEAHIRSLRTRGQPLPGSARKFFEPRFGVDFSQVRVHTDAHAAQSARSLNARAFTVGRDIVFGVGQYAPGKVEGRRLLAHEFTHIVQQGQLIGASRLNSLSVMRQRKPKPKTPASSALSIRLDFYPGKPIDAGEVLLGTFAKRREKAGKTKAIDIESLDDIFLTLQIIAKEIKKRTGKKKVMPFMSELHILGHGNPGDFGIGTYMYNAQDLERLKAGKAQNYMKTGATIYLEGCNAAAGSKGKQFMYQMGRVFFGSKTGYLWGNTCTVFGPVLEITTCRPVKYKYPDDFKKNSSP